MKKVYLDYNVWQEMYKNEGTKSYFTSKSDWEYYISVAHFEELFHAKNNEIEKYQGNAAELKSLMLKLSKQGILKPTYNGVCFFDGDEDIQKAIDAIEKNHNTQDIIKQSGEKILSGRNSDNNLNSIEGVRTEDIYKKIWMQEKVLNIIDSKNQVRKKIENDLVDYPEEKYIVFIIVMSLRLMGYDFTKEYLKDITEEYISKVIEGNTTPIEQNSFIKIKEKYYVLESIMEELFNILEEVGFKQDKDLRKVVSGIYDVQHFIQATFCDIFITKDKKFKERCEAVAWYLDIPIKILRWDDSKKKLF